MSNRLRATGLALATVLLLGFVAPPAHAAAPAAPVLVGPATGSTAAAVDIPLSVTATDPDGDDARRPLRRTQGRRDRPWRRHRRPVHDRRAPRHAELHLRQPPGHDDPADPMGRLHPELPQHSDGDPAGRPGQQLRQPHAVGLHLGRFRGARRRGGAEHGGGRQPRLRHGHRRVQPVRHLLPAVPLRQQGLEPEHGRPMAATSARTCSDPTRSIAATWTTSPCSAPAAATSSCSTWNGRRPRYTLDWAAKVLAAYPNRIAILSTHSFVQINGLRNTVPQRPGGIPAETVWTHVRVAAVLDQAGAQRALPRRRSRRGEPFRPQQLRAARAADPHRLPGPCQRRRRLAALLHVHPVAGTMTATTYSPKLDQFETDADSSFTAPLRPRPTRSRHRSQRSARRTSPPAAPRRPPGPGLGPDTLYEWRAVATDATGSTTSSTWTVRTPQNSRPRRRHLLPERHQRLGSCRCFTRVA